MLIRDCVAIMGKLLFRMFLLIGTDHLRNSTDMHDDAAASYESSKRMDIASITPLKETAERSRLRI